jgi:hypothetical protein
VRTKALAFAIALAQINGSGNAHRAITEAKPASLPPIDTDAKPVVSSSGQSWSLRRSAAVAPEQAVKLSSVPSRCAARTG